MSIANRRDIRVSDSLPLHPCVSQIVRISSQDRHVPGSRPVKVLLIEDEAKISSYVTKALVRAGHTVNAITDGQAGLITATTDPYDVIILDLGLPGRDGLEILGAIRERSISTPVLILTARGDVKDRIAGLNRGADDYLAKPFSMEELLARVNVLTRRKGEDASPLLRVGDLVMNDTTHAVTRDGKTVHLSQREYEVLHFLMMHAGRTVTRTEICEHVWKSALANDTNAVDVYIQRLRVKVDEDFPEKLIQTVRGTGYVMGAAKK
jgi:DNA-binding response OmpR family regulator